jgi:hypothetical protein
MSWICGLRARSFRREAANDGLVHTPYTIHEYKFENFDVHTLEDCLRHACVLCLS